MIDAARRLLHSVVLLSSQLNFQDVLSILYNISKTSQLITPVGYHLTLFYNALIVIDVREQMMLFVCEIM